MNTQEIARLAAEAWANAHAGSNADPVEFGAKVAQVYRAALTVAHGGDEKATAAALAALSVPVEVWQSLAQLSSLVRPTPERHSAAESIGAEA